jgi:dienelactone hydrolase
MNTFRPSTYKPSKVACLIAALGLGVALAAFAPGQQGPPPRAHGDSPSFLDEFRGGKARDLPLFLDDFVADKETPLTIGDADFPSAVGKVRGFWARPDSKTRVPAVLLVYDEATWTDWMKTNSRHLASIGYEVLLVNVQPRRIAAGESVAGATDEATLAELLAAVRWLRGRSAVLPNRLGVVGWGWSGGQALALASATSMQACVICDASLPTAQSVVVGLRETPLLGLFAGADKPSQRTLAGFRTLVAAQQVPWKERAFAGARPGFMGPPERKAYDHDAAEEAWVAIYNFLEKHVEDARPSGLAVASTPAQQPVATIADIMRAVNEPTGLRGTLSKALEQKPSNDRQWARMRANAALVAEAGAWLRMRTPSKGPVEHWHKQARAFTGAAKALVAAADKKDYPAAQRSLVMLAEHCAACHEEHR